MRTPNVLRIFGVIFITSVNLATCANYTCGSLLTYRQFSTVLESAPQCFRDGCGGTNSSTSMDSVCPTSAPCSPFWSLLKEQWDAQEWCDSCSDDIACRIPGWPVWNASATCNAEPHASLFEANCCSNVNEPAELARWLGDFCNGTDWKEEYFGNFGFMAQRDWEGWIIPRNLTLEPVNIPAEERDCTGTSLYMGVFFVENVIYLLAAISFAWGRLGWIKRKERKLEAEIAGTGQVATDWNIRHLWWLPRRFFGNDQAQHPFRPSFLTRSFFGAVLPAIVGTLTAGLTVGLNFLSAWLVTLVVGYEHIDWRYLGLLFCCRPRLTWLACTLGLLRRYIPHKYYRRRVAQTAAKATISSVAVSSTISEGLLQIVGLYYMGITADSGRVKGFYYAGHLTPYWKGTEAMLMYSGALLWLVACIPIILVWPLIAYNQSRLFEFMRRLRIKLTEKLHLPSLTPTHHNQVSEDSLNEPFVPAFYIDEREQQELGFDPAEWQHQVLATRTSNWDPATMQQNVRPVRRDPQRPVTNRPEDMQELVPGGRRPLRGGQGTPSTPSIRPEEMQEAITPASGPSSSQSRIYLRGGAGGSPGYMGYSGPRNDQGQTYEEQVQERNRRRRAAQRNASHSYEYSSVRQFSGGSLPDTEYRGATGHEEYEMRKYPQHQPPSHQGHAYSSIRQVSAGSDYDPRPQARPHLRGGVASDPYEETYDEASDPDTHERRKYEHAEGVMIWMGIIIGSISYVAQWLFWVGFVKALGERYCHPQLVKAGVIWAVSSILSGIIPFGAQ